MRNFTLLILLLMGIDSTGYGQKLLTIRDIQQLGTFSPKTVSGLKSMNNDNSYTVLENQQCIVQYSYRTGEKEKVIFDISLIKNAPVQHFSAYQFSTDETKLLLTTDRKGIYRHSYTAEYYIYNFVTKKLTSLSTKGRQQVATFSPDGERIAFVRNNNVFIKTLKFGTEAQLTWDGKQNKIINGIPDWVYEEEFSFNKAFAWSPDSKFLAYIKFDESEVPEYTLPMYQGAEPRLTQYAEYPGNRNYKYPKAGQKNATVSVHIYELKSRTTVDADTGKDSTGYIPRIKWTTDAADLAIMQLNRHQNELDIRLANPYTGDTRHFFTEKNQRYIDENFMTNFIFLPGNKYFVINSERDGYSHLYLYNRQGFLVRQLTKGKFDVTSFYGFDAKRQLFYYQAAKESPMRREIYFVSLDGKKEGKLSTKNGTNQAVFSGNFNYYINYFTNLTTPNTVTLHHYDGKLIRVLEDNKSLTQKLTEYNLTSKKFFTFTTSEGIQLNGWILKPPHFDASKKYPLIMTQYSGPNSQEVLDKWSVDWSNYLAQEGFVVACVDPRGTGARGEDFRKITYLQLGKYESDDQVDAAKYLGSLPYVDKQNIAIWGWSYGGFMSLLTLEKGGHLFKAGIAVAPVTNWRFYDTIYTERYMRTPKENPDGYDQNCPMAHPENIKSHLLIIHGSADDNVHLQNTMEFTEQLVQDDIPFDMAIYTNRNHSISGGNTRIHLYRKMTHFLETQLQGK